MRAKKNCFTAAKCQIAQFGKCFKQSFSDDDNYGSNN